jgi:hypothetical protein
MIFHPYLYISSIPMDSFITPVKIASCIAKKYIKKYPVT